MPNIGVETDSVSSAGTRIQALSGQIEDLIGQMMNTARSVTWTGNAHNAFESAMGEWQTAAMNIREASQQIGTATGTAAVNYTDAETTNTGMFG